MLESFITVGVEIIIIRNSTFMGYEIGKLCQCGLFMQRDNDPLAPAALEQRDKEEQQRMFSPSAARNSAPILDVMKHVFPKRGLALEIGCGTGEHVVSFGESMPNLMWQPSDPDLGSRASTASWIKFKGLNNVMAPLDIDVCSKNWGVEPLAPFDAIVSINMVHVAPWAATLGLFAGAGRLLRDGAILYLYGPFMHDGVHNASSNAAFDEALKASNPSWGLRDISDLERVAGESGLRLTQIIEMPANNKSLVFSYASRLA